MYANLPDGTKIYYNINGNEDIKVKSNEKYLVFLHGGPGMVDHNLYLPFWSKLSSVINVIFIDMRGHGKSSGHDTQDKWNLSQWGKDVYDFCEVLGIIQPVIAGVSFGSWVALSYATQFPHHPKALILCHAEAKIDMEKRKAAYKRKAEKLGLDGDEIANIVQQLRDKRGDSKTNELFVSKCIPLYSTKPYTQNDFSKCIRNLKVWEFFEEEQYNFDYFPLLKNIIAPTLVVAGEDDPEHPPECAVEMVNSLSNSQAKCVIISGAGAPVYNEKEEETLHALHDFIRNLKQCEKGESCCFSRLKSKL